MTLRRILFWIHLTAGVLAGSVIFVMSLTGVLLAFERQILRSASRSYYVKAEAGAQRLAVSELVERAGSAANMLPSAITLRADPTAPAEMSSARDRVLFVDPYTGTIIGESRRLPASFSRVEDFHRWLGVSPAKRTLGRSITGACNLLFLVLVVTGPILWWPKEWRWGNLRKVIFFRRSLGGRALYWNWHNVLGIWCFLPLLVIVMTGVVMSYPWANNLVYRVTGNEPPSPVGRPEQPRAETRFADAEKAQDSNSAIGQLVAYAQQKVPGWQSITLRLPSERGPLTATVDEGNGGRPDLRSQFSWNRKTNEIRQETFSSYNAGRRLRTWMRFSHTGEAAGLLGQSIAATATAAASLLVLTGLVLSLKRLLAWRSNI